MTYNRTMQRLQGPVQKTPEPSWTRFVAFEPVVPIAQFRKAQERLVSTRGWNKEAIAASLRKLLARDGYLNQKLIQNSEICPSSVTVAYHFGSLHAAYVAIGYTSPPVSPFGNNGRHWSRKEIMAGLRTVYETKGYVSYQEINKSKELPSYAFIREHYGGIPKVMQAAGLPVLSHSEVTKRGWERRNVRCEGFYQGVRWTDERLLRGLRRLDKQYGYVSANLLDQDGVIPTAYYYSKRFGSLANARVLAKLPPRSHSEVTTAGCKRRKEGTLIRRRPRHPGQPRSLHYRSDDILEGLRRLARQNGAISGAMIDDDFGLPSAATVANHFGSMSAAYRLAGLVRLEGWPIRHGLPSRK
jgi:hypothetical protein